MIDLWTSTFGDDYTRRQADTVNIREVLWRNILPRNCESILEVGANVGANLEAIARFHPFDLYGTEPNEIARRKLTQGGFCFVSSAKADKLDFDDDAVDLVFTCGVLIHIPPDQLIASLTEIYRVASRYIIAAEYFAPSEEMIPYRGHDNALWRRDYGSLYLDTFPDLRCTSCTFAWKRQTGLDNLTIWVFEKGQRN